ncbi:MAG: sulfotransferase, partial [Pseudomonadales bacterium]
MSESRAQQQSILADAQARLQGGDPAGARTLLVAAVAAQPDDTDARYMLAVAERYAGADAAALDTLRQLLQLAPEHGRAFQELGHLHKAAGRTTQSIAAYGRAIALNPALLASYQGQIELLRGMQRDQQLRAVQARLTWLQEQPKPLVAVMDLIAQNRLAKAEQLCRTFLQQQPQHVEGMRLLADIGSRLGVLDDAEFLLESAVEFAPANTQARMDYVQVLRKRQKFAAALQQARALLDQDPTNPQFLSLYAIEQMQTGDFDAALTLLDEVLARVPGDAATLTNKGHALKTSGRSEEAISAYQNAIAQHPSHGEAYYALANLKTYRFSAVELTAMQEQLRAEHLHFMQRVYLFFALGKAYEDREDYDASFSHYAQGNALKKAQSRYDAQQMHDEFAATKTVCDAALFARHADHGAIAADPIFVVGLPRAGSTLLEQVLASHSQVDGTLELPNVLSLSQHLRRRAPGYPAVLQELSAEELRQFGECYLEETRIHRQGAPRFIDKMPNNFRHIGLIKLMLPNARIIDARRGAMACCFSGFKQLFAEGQEFSYDLSDIGRYYRDYVSLMDHWDEVLPGFVLRVQHEAVVNNLEEQVRRLLAFCDLPFEEQCLRFYETERNVRTPSSEQVRQPIFADSIAQWRSFEPHLDPLKQALGE